MVVANVLAMRSELLRHNRVFIHADVHPGNVVLRRAGRVRSCCSIGDESESRDTLLKHYLAARGVPPVLIASVRRWYWLAGCVERLAGALRYHVSVAADDSRGDRTGQESSGSGAGAGAP